MKNNKLSYKNITTNSKTRNASATFVIRSFIVDNITIHEFRCYWEQNVCGRFGPTTTLRQKNCKTIYDNKHNAIGQLYLGLLYSGRNWFL